MKYFILLTNLSILIEPPMLKQSHQYSTSASLSQMLWFADHLSDPQVVEHLHSFPTVWWLAICIVMLIYKLLPISYREMENTMWDSSTSFSAESILSYLAAVFDLNIILSSFHIMTGKKWCGSMCVFGCGEHLGTELSFQDCLFAYYLAILSFGWYLEIALISKPLKHTKRESEKEVQNDVEAQMGAQPCL